MLSLDFSISCLRLSFYKFETSNNSIISVLSALSLFYSFWLLLSYSISCLTLAFNALVFSSCRIFSLSNFSLTSLTLIFSIYRAVLVLLSSSSSYSEIVLVFFNYFYIQLILDSAARFCFINSASCSSSSLLSSFKILRFDYFSSSCSSSSLISASSCSLRIVVLSWDERMLCSSNSLV